MTGPVSRGRDAVAPLPLPKIPQQLLLHDRIVAEMLDRADDLLDVVGSASEYHLTG